MANVISQLMVMLGADSSPLNDALDQTIGKVGNWAAAFTGLVGGISFAGLALSAIKGAEAFEEAGARIQRATGATGDSLHGLESVMTDLYTGSARSAGEIAGVLSQLTIRTGLTGDALESLAKSTLNFAKVTGSDLSTAVQSNEKLFQQWGIATKDQAAALDVLYVASQKTGASATQIGASLQALGPVLRSFGFDFLDATALIGTFEKAGLDASEMVRGLNALFLKFAAAGKDPKQALADLIAKLSDTSTATAAVNVLIEEGFSKRSAVAMAEAAQRGALSIGGLRDALTGARGKVDEAAAATDTFEAKLTKLGHAFEDLTKGPASKVLDFFTGLVEGANEAIKSVDKLATALANLKLPDKPKSANTFKTVSVPGLSGRSTAAPNSIEALTGEVAQNSGMAFVNTFGLMSSQTPPPPAPITTLGTPGQTGAGGMTQEQIDKLNKDLFSTVKMEDYRTELAKITEAFDQLVAAGKLTASQQEAVRDRIQELKDKIADYRPAFLQLADAKPFQGQISTLDALSEKHLTLSSQLADTIKYLQAYANSGTHLGALWVSSLTGVSVAELEVQTNLKKIADSAPRQFFGSKAYDDLTDVGKALDQAGIYVQKIDPTHLKQVTDQLQAIGAFGLQVPPELERINSALQTLGLGSSRDDVAKLQTAFQGLNEALVKGAITQEEYNRGYVNYVDDLKKEGVQIDANTQKIYDQIKAHLENLKAVQQYHDQTQALFKDSFEGIEHDFADMVTTANFSWDSMAKTGQKFASDIYAMFLKALFQPLENAFKKLGAQLGDALGGIWSSTSTPTINAASTAAQSAASAGASGGAAAAQATQAASQGAAAAATTSLTGVLGAIGSIGSFVTGVIGDIQNIHTNNLLGEIEVSTRSSLAELQNTRRDLWSQFGSMYDRLGEVLNSIRAGSGSLSGAAMNNLSTIADYAVLAVHKLDEFVIPDLNGMLDLMQRGATAGAGGGIVIQNLYLQAQDPRQFMQQLSRVARSQGVFSGLKNI